MVSGMTVTVMLWLVAVVQVLGVFSTISSIGKPRKPLDANVAACVVAVNAFLIYAVVRAALER